MQPAPPVKPDNTFRSPESPGACGGFEPRPASIEQIRASAGSGKTYALTQRFLDLLALAGARPAGAACLRGPGKGFAWTDILAATFTNKAAGEMRERVVERLKRCALGLESGLSREWTPAKAAFWVDTLLCGYGSLNIRTIDSLLISLVRLCALDLGLPPDFEPAFGRAEYFEPLFEEAVAADGGEFAEPLRAAFLELLRHTDSGGFDLGAELRENLGVLFDMAISGDPLPQHPAAELAAERSRLAAGAIAAAGALLERLAREDLSVDKRFTKHLTECADLAGERTLPDRVWPYRRDLDDCLLSASKGCASDAARRDFAAYAAAWKRAERGMILLTRAMRLAPLARLAAMLAERLPAFQRKSGLVPYALTALHARRILEEGAAGDAFCRMGTRLTHILVDEFQDTSRGQWAALEPLAAECLSTGGSLTLVGDAKQAIYRWRGGDPTLFDEAAASPELARMLEEPAGRSTLGCNRRSCRAVVEHNNRVFALLGDADTARCVVAAMLPGRQPRYADESWISAAAAAAGAALCAAFADARQAMPPGGAERPEGYVRLEPVAGATAGEYAEEARERLRRLFLEELRPRRAWKDVAVLVHKNVEAAAVAEWLMEWGVPTVTDQSLVLARHPLIRQIAAFLSFMDNPADDVSFWALAAAHADDCPSLIGEELAALGLSWPYLADWLMERGSARGQGSLAALFQADFPEAWRSIFAPFARRSGLIGAYDATAELLFRFAAARRFPEDMACLRRFLEIAHQAEVRGISSLSAFLGHWAEHGASERVPMPEAPDAVRILTMHKAKGLEFPVVVIPFHHQSGGEPEPERCRMGGRELILRPSPAQGEPYYHARAEAAAEKLRVLYVAWTRAVEELYGFLPGPDLDVSPLARGLHVLLAAAGIDPETRYESGKLPPARRRIAHSAPDDVFSPGGRDVPADFTNWRPMSWLPRLKIFRSPLDHVRPTGRPAVLSETQRGLFVHRCLEELVALRPPAESGNPPLRLEEAVRMAVAAFPLAVPEALAAEALDMLAWAAALPGAAVWFRHGRAEQSVLDEEGAVHRADLLVRSRDGILVVEYKTGAPSEAHRGQTARYMSLLARQETTRRNLSGRENAEQSAISVTGVLVYLDSRTVEAVRPERL